MIKQLARLSELRDPEFNRVMKQINKIADEAGLQQYTTFSRLWEYPWIWLQLQLLKQSDLSCLDIGSERSPFPWFLRTQGFRVIVSDVTAGYWQVWQGASRQLGLTVQRRILDAQQLDLPTASVDIYQSVSVIEHVSDKAKAIAEAARVLRPGGLLVMTFDICEPDMGMSFPDWNGRALTMREFDDLFGNSPWLESGLFELSWNTDDIPEYLAWHRTTAPHHNYVTGAAVVRRNDRPWTEPVWKDCSRALKGRPRTLFTLASWHLQHSKVAQSIKSVVRGGPSLLTSHHVALLFGEPFFRLLGMRGKKQDIDLLQVKRVLVVRLDEIGDVVMTTPFLRGLRLLLPEAWITLVVKPQVYNLVEFCPYVNEVITYVCYASGKLSQVKRHARAMILAWKHLWHRRFDLVIVPRWDVDYYNAAFLAYFSGGQWRLGYSEEVNENKKQLNKGNDHLFTTVLNNGTLKHEVEHNLSIIHFLGGPKQREEQLELWLTEKDEAFADQVVKSQGARPDDLLVALGPGAGHPKRIWPICRFVELGDWLRKACHARILVVGGKGEELLGRELQQKLGDSVINLIGKTNLRQTGAILKRCHIYVGNDAGPMHLAAAVDVAVIEISCHPHGGSPLHHNSPMRFGPWGVPHVVLQPKIAVSPCSLACNSDLAHCILSVAVEEVKRAIMAIANHTEAKFQKQFTKQKFM